MTYHLDNQKEIEKVKENLLIFNSHRLHKESLILVDPTDIVKSKAKKMEGLSKVRDGSDGKCKIGYEGYACKRINHLTYINLLKKFTLSIKKGDFYDST